MASTLKQNFTNQSLGNLVNHQKGESGISGETTFGKFRIIIYNETICRLAITAKEGFSNFSYSVIAQPQKNDFALEELDDRLSLRTSRFHLTISKNPVRFSFTDHQGRVL